MSATNQSSKRSSRGWILIVVIGLLLLAVVFGIVKLIQAAPNAGAGEGASGAPKGPPPASVYVEAVELGSAQNASLATGTLRAKSRSEVAAREAESVAEVLVDDGDQVKAGDVLVRLYGDRLDAQIVEVEAQMRTAEKMVNQRQAEQQRADTDFEMKEGLLKDLAISRSEFLDAQSKATIAKSQSEAAAEVVNEAKSRIDLLKIRRKDLEVRAPFAGLIAERHVELGEWLAAGTPVVTLVTVDPVEAWMSVPERYLRDVNDQPMDIRVRLSSTGEIFAPKAVKIVPDVERRSQLFTVVATLDNSSGQLAPGQSITGAVPIGKDEKHFQFPVDALLRSRLGDFVYVVDASGEGPMPVGRKVLVDIAFERDETIFVNADGAGLKKGDRVVTEGNDRLLPGQMLVVREEGEGAPQVKP